MAKWNSNAYPRRVLLNQMQLGRLIAERRTLNEWHAVRVFADAIFGQETRDIRIRQGASNERIVTASKIFVESLEVDMQTAFWRSMIAHNALYTESPATTLVQDILKLWSTLLPESQLDWGRHELPELTYVGPIAIPAVMETETTYADETRISLSEYQRIVDRFTSFFPNVRVEPGLHSLIGYFHWQFRTGQLSIEAVAERLNVFVFDLVQLWMHHDLEVYPEGAEGDYLIDPERLARYLKQELVLYASDPVEMSYSESNTTYSLGSASRSSPEDNHIFMQVQIKANRIIITIDHTDKPLFEALLHAGVPREQMVFAWMNNTRPLTYNPPEGA